MRIAAAFVAVLLSSSAVRAEEPARPPPSSIETRVAEALFKRGMKLWSAQLYRDARSLFLESLVRDPKGPRAKEAREMILKCDAKIGGPATQLPPEGGPTEGLIDDAPIDPYGSPGTVEGATTGTVEDAAPIDPYDEPMPSPDPAPIDPYGADATTGATRATSAPAPPPPPYGARYDLPPPQSIDPLLARRREARQARTQLYLWSGAFGYATGISLAHSVDEDPDDGVILLGLAGAGVGLAASYAVTRNVDLTEGDVAAAASGGTWGAIVGGLIAMVLDDPTACDSGAWECVTGEDVTESNYFQSILAGSAVGLGGGIYAARRLDPSAGDVSMVNSFTAYGMAIGLMIGLAIDPPQDRAYALNALVGGGAGAGFGLWLAPRVETTRSRMLLVDLGALLGGIGGVLIGTAVGGGEDSDDGARVAGGVGAAGIAVGAYLAWRFTRGRDAKPAAQAAAPAPPALLARDAAGKWRVGVPAPQPIAIPGRAPAMGVSVISGTF